MAGPKRRAAPEEEGNCQGHKKERKATNLIKDKDKRNQRKTILGKRTTTKPRKMNLVEDPLDKGVRSLATQPPVL